MFGAIIVLKVFENVHFNMTFGFRHLCIFQGKNLKTFPIKVRKTSARINHCPNVKGLPLELRPKVKAVLIFPTDDCLSWRGAKKIFNLKKERKNLQRSFAVCFSLPSSV
jgi:hypothetical protein